MTLRRKMETDYSRSDTQTTDRYPREKFVSLMFGKRATDFFVSSASPALIEEVLAKKQVGKYNEAEAKGLAQGCSLLQ